VPPISNKYFAVLAVAATIAQNMHQIKKRYFATLSKFCEIWVFFSDIHLFALANTTLRVKRSYDILRAAQSLKQIWQIKKCSNQVFMQIVVFR
jgi:hypothetical protein